MSGIKADVIVLGAGIVGVSTALQLQARGRQVLLVDRLGVAGEETSYGNLGIIQSEAVFPYMFPRKLSEIALAAINCDPRVQIRYDALPAIGSWLWRYFLASSPQARLTGARAIRALAVRSVAEHESLAAQAGSTALLRKTGWITVFRTERGRQSALAEAEELKPYGVESDVLDRAQLEALEPYLTNVAAGGVHFIDPSCTPDPGALVKSYSQLFVSRGGRLVTGDARSLASAGFRWSITACGELHEVPEVVVALGPWSSDLLYAFGYSFPFGVKRGYHMHYAATGAAILNRPVLDAEYGYALAPQARGIRLTTGVEFARRDDPASPAHLNRVEPFARQFFPLGERCDTELWLGRRPCLPDMLPVIGAAPRHKGLWLNFGHQHLGLTLGPVSGLLLAQVMTGEAPFADPTPYRIERFA